jgi:nicotinamidase-related amidase
MSRKKKDSQGIAEHRSKVVLLLIDVVNDFEFEGGEELAQAANKIAKNIAAIKRRAKDKGIPVVYVIDNFGKWRTSLEIDSP